MVRIGTDTSTNLFSFPVICGAQQLATCWTKNVWPSIRRPRRKALHTTAGVLPNDAGQYTRMEFLRAVKPGFHYPSRRPELTARVDG